MSVNAIGTCTENYVSEALHKNGAAERGNRKEKQPAVSCKNSSEEYLKELQKNNPELNITAGSVNPEIRQGGASGKTNIVIAPNILRQMANDPAAEKKYGQMLRDIPAAAKWADSMIHALTGSEVKYRQTWIDEQGNMGSMCVTGPSEKQKKVNEMKKDEKEEWMKKIIETRKQKAEELEKLRKGNKHIAPGLTCSDMLALIGFNGNVNYFV